MAGIAAGQSQRLQENRARLWESLATSLEKLGEPPEKLLTARQFEATSSPHGCRESSSRRSGTPDA